MGIGLLLIIVVVIVLLFDGGAFFKRLLGEIPKARSDSQHNPQKILEMRLARGEIDLAEYEEIRNHLDNTKVTL